MLFKVPLATSSPGCPGIVYDATLAVVLEMPVAARCAYMIPAVPFNHPDQIAYFHFCGYCGYALDFFYCTFGAGVRKANGCKLDVS